MSAFSLNFVTLLARGGPRTLYMKSPDLKSINEKRDRPLLVTLCSAESKLVLFKNIHRIKELTEYEKVNVSNNLTKAEREKEKQIWQEAKNNN
jgi:hypothetical protein